MGLRCLLGHDFGPTEVEREREEDGEEMVVTIREVKTCNRCGEERVVSENKEVTSIRTPEEIGLDEQEPDETAAEKSTEGAATDESAEVPDIEDAEGAGTSGAESVSADEDGSAELDEDFVPPESAEEDDGVILGEDESAPDREPGQWPDEQGTTSQTPMQDEASGGSPEDEGAVQEADEPPADDTGTSIPADEDAEFIDADEATDAIDAAEGETLDAETDQPAQASSDAATSEQVGDQAGNDQADDEQGWPDPKGADEGFAAESGVDGSEDISFGGNSLTPEVDSEPEPEDDAEFVSNQSAEPTGTPESDIARADRHSFELDDPSGADTIFYCPNCELTRPAEGSSLRSGDICPECRKGYLAERDA